MNGCGASALDSVVVYDQSTATWTEIAPLNIGDKLSSHALVDVRSCHWQALCTAPNPIGVRQAGGSTSVSHFKGRST